MTVKYNIEFPLNGVNLVKINKEILIKMDLDSDWEVQHWISIKMESLVKIKNKIL